MTTAVSLPTSCSYQLNPPYSSWSLLSPGEAEGGKGGEGWGNVVKPMTEQSRPEGPGHVPEAYVRSDGRPAAACGRRGRISSRAPRCWTEGAGWRPPRRCGRLSRGACPRCKVTATASRTGGWHSWTFLTLFMQSHFFYLHNNSIIETTANVIHCKSP